jgi:uncharacterized protein YaiL (DUF2058 family)
MSLQEQLLKAGLVSAEKLKKVETETRKQLHQSRKNKAVAAAEVARKAEEKHRLEAEAARKKELDRQLNREREGQKKLREDMARARQLLESRRLNEVDADIPYNFLMNGHYIRSVRVTRQQQKLLAMGRIGIVRNADDEYDFLLVSRETALKLAEIFPDGLLLLHPQSDSVEDQEGNRND